MLTYLQATVIGAVQGVTELFPVSSLGHSVLIAEWLGGDWKELATPENPGDATPYLAFIVALHVATVVALLAFYRRDWYVIIRGFFATLRSRRLETVPQRMAWLLVIGTVPVALIGSFLEHPLHALFEAPIFASVFLTLNGVLLLLGDQLRRRNEPTLAEYGRRFALQEASRELRSTRTEDNRQSDRRIAALGFRDALGIGFAQVGALFPGFSRAGVTMVGGLWRGLEHQFAAKLAFLLATPVIMGAGILELPSLFGPETVGIRGPIIVGAVVSGTSSWLAVRYLERYFETRTLLPFAVYCIFVGLASTIRFM